MDTLDYKPSPRALDAIKNVTLVAVVGPTGVGKTTLVEAAIKRDPHLHLVLSHTSRPPRDDEQDGVDYHFRSYQEMVEQMEQGKFVQMPHSYTGYLYATAPESYHPGGISIMAVIADAIPSFRALPFKAVRTIFVAPPSLRSWHSRLKEGRNALSKRLDEARRSFEFALKDDQTVFVVNDDLDQAAQELLLVAHGHQLTPKLEADQAHAKQIVRRILGQLESPA